MNIKIEGEMPSSLLLAFLQCIRTFDQQHANCHFEMFAGGDDITNEEIQNALDNVVPPFKFTETFNKQ